MNREIKFRVWDKNNKIMFYPVKGFNLDTYIMSNGYPAIDQSTWERHPFGTKCNEKPQYILQQYTGLKDKNAKDIYEGDILLYKLSYVESQGGQLDNILYKVIYENGAFWSLVIDKNKNTIKDLLYDQAPSEDEIVGNIFENSELLK